jgi:hypothetical protein
MPVRKYRDVKDMPQDGDHWRTPGDPAIYRGLLRMCRLATSLAGPLGVPAGVRKFRSAEEAYADRERWEAERIARIQAERMKK